MVHKKFIKRGNKIFGPYLYENYREKGVVKTRYLGKGKEKRNFRNFLLIGFIVLIFIILILSGFLLFSSSKKTDIEKLKGNLRESKSFQVSVILRGFPPQIIGVPDEILVCENTRLNYSFRVIDTDGDLLGFFINPRTHIPFYVYPEFSEEGETSTDVEVLTLRNLIKGDVNHAEATRGRSWAVYPEIISAAEVESSPALSDSKETNITIIEVNNEPEIGNIGARTIWTRGDNTIFSHTTQIRDLENGDENSNKINLSLSFWNTTPFFNMTRNGIMFFNATNRSELIGVYNLSVCAKDSGIEEPHRNISLCWNYGWYADAITSCRNFSLTITNENRKPNITSYYPFNGSIARIPNESINVKGSDILYFNLTKYDADGTIPDNYWYVNDTFKEYDYGRSFDEFEYSFGCDISGNYIIKAIVSDGELNNSVYWNFSVQYVSCPAPSSGGGGGGGGGGSVFCKEKWVCNDWSQCKNLKEAEKYEINKKYSSLIKERCKLLDYKEAVCGYQERVCSDLNYCKTNLSKPGIIKECYFSENPDCKDGIKNCHNGSCEILTDCGGPCLACPSCFDNIKNQNETDVDCGGPCPRCKEMPVKPVLFRSIFSYSLLALFILILLLFINQVRKYYRYRKIFRAKKLKEKIEKKQSKNYIKLFLLIFIVFLLFFANSFIMNIAHADKIFINREGGFLGTQGFSNFFIRGIAKLFMIDIINIITKSVDNANLGVWDDSDDSEKGDRYSYCTNYCIQKNKIDSRYWDVYFYANYTNLNNEVIDNNNGNCLINFNENGWGNWNSINFNATSLLWEYKRSFNNKGKTEFNISCASNYGNIDILDNVSITNTEPYIVKEPSGYLEGILQCSEDSMCYYDFSLKVSEDDLNDDLDYGYILENTSLTDFSIDSLTGILNINITHSRYTGTGKKVELTVRDTESTLQSALLKVDVQEVNDAPVFINLENKEFNATELFEYIINISDEENNIPFKFNISFLGCSVAEWSDRKISGDCKLFNETQYAIDSEEGWLKISFVPTRNDVGVYVINFSVMDNSSLGNMTTSKIVNFSVLNINQEPFFRYLCDDERNSLENRETICWINASDIDEINNLTFSANFSWFKFYNGSAQLNPVSVKSGISTNYNASAMVNFTPSDLEVGNWLINISVSDTGSPVKRNSSVFPFFIANVEDLAILELIPDLIIYENKTIYANASDDDLLVPDKSVKNEFLIFNSNASWVKIIRNFTIGGNKASAEIKIDFDSVFSLYGAGEHYARINVLDRAGNSDFQELKISVFGDNAPEWNIPNANIISYEDNEVYLNLSENVSDAEGDSIIFSYSNGNFPGFSLTSNGIINFTPRDEDVGEHILTINASDGKLNSFRIFNFSIYNIPDMPYIKPIKAIDVINASVVNSRVNVAEDNTTTVYLWIEDNDFKIRQKNFFNESLIVNTIISGPNTALFSFIADNFYPVAGENLTKYDAKFTPGKSDVGDYNITINASDKNNISSIYRFNLTVTSIEHAPVLMNFTNYSSKVNGNFHLDINASDAEDIDDSSGKLQYSYNFIYGNDFINNNENIFNLTSGILNISFNFNESGEYNINISASDSSGRKDYKDFWLFVYEPPVIDYPLNGCEINLKENLSSNIIVRVGHKVEDNLNYKIYFNESLKFNANNLGNNSDVNLLIVPNFSDETYGNETKNLVLLASNIIYPELNSSISCSLKIEHTNAPVIFNGWIGDKSTTFANSIAIDLGLYFSDIDYSDINWKQQVNFMVESNATGNSSSKIGWGVYNWTLVLFPLVQSQFMERLNIIANDFEYSARSNNFIIEFTVPETVTVTTPSGGGGGGGGGSEQIVFLKIIVPGKISAYEYDKIRIPIYLVNGGKKSFEELSLNSIAFKDGSITKKVNTSLDKSYLKSLKAGGVENLTLTVFFNTDKIGDYEILVNVSSKEPKYTDWGKIHINLQRINESRVKEMIVFTKEFIVQNPLCKEITEIIEEADILFQKGDLINAKLKTEQALDACEKSISQVSLPRQKERFYGINLFLFLGILLAILMGLFYYFWKRREIEQQGVNKNLEFQNIDAQKGLII